MADLSIRRFATADAPDCAALFHRAVHEGTTARYTPAQRAAWSPRVPGADRFAAKLGACDTWVAVEGDRIVGFMSLLPRSGSGAHLGMAFVAPERMGQGVADRLYDALLAHAHREALTRLTVEASHLARAFFLRRGWSVDAAQSVERDGVRIPNVRMSVSLEAPVQGDPSERAPRMS
ncbi:MAG: GNAT family N-acetyltransferase [Shimia sp.]